MNSPRKKLLLIQLDDAYFLSELMQLIHYQHEALEAFDLTVLCQEEAFQQLRKPLQSLAHMSFDQKHVLDQHYDMSINVSLNEASWELQERIKAPHKGGFRLKNGQLLARELWSSFFLTIKSRGPFLTFHLQDIYKNILGIKRRTLVKKPERHFRYLIMGTPIQKLFPDSEQEDFINNVGNRFPVLKIKDINDIHLTDQAREMIYLGPATLESNALCAAGAQGIFITSGFQGFNLLPNEDGTYLVSSAGEAFKASTLMTVLEGIWRSDDKIISRVPHVYRLDKSQGLSYLENLSSSEEHYPFYQIHSVLWNFILNLSEQDLPFQSPNETQRNLLAAYLPVITKLVRLHEYAMVSLEVIHQESKSTQAQADIIDGHLKNLREIEASFDKISESHSMLRSLLDYYRIRKGQNEGTTLFQQVQENILTYAEEHQALKAMEDMLNSFLQKK